MPPLVKKCPQLKTFFQIPLTHLPPFLSNLSIPYGIEKGIKWTPEIEAYSGFIPKGLHFFFFLGGRGDPLPNAYISLIQEEDEPP